MSDHTERRPSHNLVFWKGNVASDRLEADRVEVEGFSYFARLSFKWPEEQLNVDKLEAMLAKAFEHGRYSAQVDFRKALGL